MATLVAHIRIRPDTEGQWTEVIRDMVAKTLANEPGVIRYEYWKREEPREYLCLLAFKDKQAFFEHQASDYHIDRPWAELIEDIRLEWVDPVDGAAPLPRTENPPLAEDAPAAIKVWEERSPVTVAPWWSSVT